MTFNRKVPLIPHTFLLGLFPFFLGCVPHLSDLPPMSPLPEQFTQSGSAERIDRWWETFNDPHLNNLITRAISGNLTLRSAWYRLQEAEAIADRESAALYPNLELFGGISRTDRGSNEFSQGESEEEVNVGLMSSYELDLWGRVRASTRAEDLRVDAEGADFQTSLLTVSAEVSRTWFRLLEAKQRVLVLNNQIETNEKSLTVLKAHFGTGQVRQADILRQEQLLEATEEERVVVEALIQTTRNQLAVLIGSPPPFIESFEAGMLPPSLPPLPNTGLPVEVISRRPDVQRAFYLLRAADEDVAAAVRDRFPRITLSASLLTEDADANKLFKDYLNSIAADLLLPVFDAGRRRAEVQRTESLQYQRFFEYGQEALQAIREVEDALIREEKQVERIARVATQVELAEKTVQLVQREYFYGTGNYLDVLEALTDLQELRRNLLIQQLSAVEFRIALCRAIAGGFALNEEERQGILAEPSGGST